MCRASGLAGADEDRGQRVKRPVATIPSNSKAWSSVSCLDRLELITSVSMVINGFLVRQEELGLPPGLAVSFVVTR